ncbi:PREDICTED: 3-phosphoshikimate 1-carboxyvinyltransferase, chloroplastic-like isoform X1 [Nelumbo nucifera]|uniref:3-phosphoshikimate 1-carboxyvinyltransferase, chloroplastic-like isoform X1 n=1 Tax=Nelumbo nucifera TaxID=4432 RepID=A0A1U8BAT6_NELNU|nr:PREDICTED: 3-phosphoshikimate 1-carboxyvinyltransferase, chloroplastic-like isoform X1 [Nelumbo nucifera]
MAHVSNMAKGIQSGIFYSNLPRTEKPRASLCRIWLGSETKSLPFGGRKYGKIAAGSIVSVRVPLRVFSASASVITSEKPSSASEIVLRPIKDISGTVKLPCSKSLSNRILLLAALSEGDLKFAEILEKMGAKVS